MGDSSSGPLGRRRALVAIASTAGTATLAGCSSLWSQTGATDVIVYNAARERKTMTVTITASDAEEAHTDRALEVDSGETIDPVNQSKLPTNSDYTVEVTVRDGPSETFDWSDPTVERAPLWVFVDGSKNIKFLLQSG